MKHGINKMAKIRHGRGFGHDDGAKNMSMARQCGWLLVGLIVMPVIAGCMATKPAATPSAHYTANTVGKNASIDRKVFDDTQTMQADKVGSDEHFRQWLAAQAGRQQAMLEYQQFLNHNLNATMPAMAQISTTARSWQACGDEPYAIPPRQLWDYLLPTLTVYNKLIQQGILPKDSRIRSVYRHGTLNSCAGGAAGSKHLLNAAIDIEVPSSMSTQAMVRLQDGLCQYWRDYGEQWQLGLGLYATGAIHLDTQGYRKWGMQFAQADSVCHDLSNQSAYN